jgi:hypothetical protein
MLLIIALLLLTDVIAYLAYTLPDNKNDQWLEV